MSENLKCIIHVDDCQEDIRSLTDNINVWNNIKSAACRRAFQKSTKYKFILEKLPDVLKPNDGYHTSCMKKFTSISKNIQVLESNTSSISLTRSHKQSSSEVTEFSNILPKTCLFCEKIRKKKGGNEETLIYITTEKAELSIREAATKLKDEKLLLKIGSYNFGDGPDFVAKEAMCHNTCRRDYLQSCKNISIKNEQNSLSLIDIRNKAFNNIMDYIKKNVIDRDQPEMASSLLDLYKNAFMDYGGTKEDIECYTVQNLLKRIESTISDGLVSFLSSNRGTVVFKCHSKSGAAAFSEALESKNSNISILKKSALLLRNEILNLEKSRILSHPLTVEDITAGEVSIPSNLKTFYNNLYIGHDADINTTDQKKRYVESSAADAIHACTNGKLITGKHLSLGLSVKSMTGSKKVVTLLNRFGHCVSNEMVRRIDMEMETTLHDSNYTPKDMVKNGNFCTATVWDNFDVNIETLSGHGTVHHTYGIAYQNMGNENNFEYEVNTPIHLSLPKNPRSFKKVRPSIDVNVDPVFKKPKLTLFPIGNTEFAPPESLAIATKKDFVWMISFIHFTKTPFWTGWNSLNYQDKTPQQKIFYLKHIQLPPTRDDVVRETMKRSLLLSKECNEEKAIVTYDLAIAKKAKQIQCSEYPEFKYLFIMFGAFHIELCWFSVLGKIIEGSGGTFYITNSHIIADGSLSKFLSGKMYNRCQRAHVLLSTALKNIHFSEFLKQNDIDINDIINSNDDCNSENNYEEIITKEMVAKYKKFYLDTKNGIHGKTAKFWIQYCDLVDLYLIFRRSYKEKDVDLFTHCLYKMTALFFATNHVNYSRWMSLYSIELLNLKIDNPVVYNSLVKGGFSIRRSPSKFSAVPVDMGLEQTINAEAKNKLKGIIAYADIDSAVNRWQVTSSMRTQIVNTVLDFAGISNYDNDHKELQNIRIMRDHIEYDNIISTIHNTLNPFSQDLNKSCLFNIETGGNASEKVEDCLLNLEKRGKELRNSFIDECQNDPNRFENPIKKIKMYTFKTESFEKTNKSKKAAEIAEVCGTRDLFGRLLYLAATENINLEITFSYPLTPIPHCMIKNDGKIRDTEKSKFLPLIEGECQSDNPSSISTVIIDGMFFIHTLTNLSVKNYRDFARILLLKAIKMATNRIDLVFDTYKSPSLKDVKRDENGDYINKEFSIGPDHKVPKDFSDLLKQSNFKKELLNFLFAEYENFQYAEVIKSKKIYISIDNYCKQLQCIDGKIIIKEENLLHGNHDEADSRIMFHLDHIDLFDPGNVVVRANDTDIVIILLTNHNLFQNCHLWMDIGKEFDNSRRYLDITMISKTLDNIDSIAGIYAFTGIDYTPSFFRKGKIRPFQLMKKKSKFIELFASFGNVPLADEMFDVAEDFVCEMYGYSKIMKLNEARYNHFTSKYKPKIGAKPLDGIKSLSANTFPPCRSVVIEQVKRAWFIAHIYKNASHADPYRGLNPQNFGWTVKDGKYSICWFLGSQIPEELESLRTNYYDSDEDINDEEDEEDDEVFEDDEL